MVSRFVQLRTQNRQAVELEAEGDVAESPSSVEGELEEELIIQEISIDGICGVY